MSGTRSHRHIALLMTFMVTLSSIGLQVNVHYCKGHISGISLLTGTDTGCISDDATDVSACCASAAEDGETCCTDKVQVTSLDYDATLSSLISIDQIEYQPILSPVAELDLSNTGINNEGSGSDPPDALFLSGASLRVLYSSLLC